MFSKAEIQMIGGQAKVLLIGITIYQAILTKNFENEKWPKWQMVNMEEQQLKF